MQLPNAISVPNAACTFEMARASWVGAFKIKGTRNKLNLNANVQSISIAKGVALFVSINPESRILH